MHLLSQTSADLSSSRISLCFRSLYQMEPAEIVGDTDVVLGRP